MDVLSEVLWILIFLMSVIVGLITRRPVIAGLFAVLVGSWQSWLALFHWNTFGMAGSLLVVVSVFCFFCGYLGGLLGLKLRPKCLSVVHGLLVTLVFIASVLLYWGGPIALEKQHKKEQLLAIDFVKNNDTVISTVGKVATLYPGLEARDTYSFLPNRYELSIKNSNFYVIVDVRRSWWVPRFVLACITAISPGQRDPFTDICKQ